MVLQSGMHPKKFLFVFFTAMFVFGAASVAQEKSPLIVLPNQDRISKDKNGKDEKFVALRIKKINGAYQIHETKVYKGSFSGLRKKQPNPGDWVIQLTDSAQKVLAQTAISSPIQTTKEIYGGGTMKRVTVAPADEFWIRAVWVDGASDIVVSEASTETATTQLLKVKTTTLTISEVTPINQQ